MLLGRDDDLARVLELTRAGARLVTVTGPPGVGKTSLLRLVAKALGSTFVELTSARDTQALCVAVGRRLGVVHREGGAVAAEELAAALGGGPCSLALDNFEQLLPEGADALATLLAGAPELVLLVTSRARLGLPDEIVHRLRPLSLPDPDATEPGELERSDAVRLFLDRARRVDGCVEPAGDDLLAVRDLVRALDGLPLAIELAGARAGVASPRTLCDLLDGRFEILSDPHGRTRSLESAIAWSYELLGPETREALAACTVFEGSFDLAGAQAVLHRSGARALDALQVLHDASLLASFRAAGGTLRYMPWTSVAEWVRAVAPESQLAAAHERHAAHYVAIEGDPTVIELEEANLLAAIETRLAQGAHDDALRAALALDPLRGVRGPLDAHVSCLDRALASDTLQRSLYVLGLRARGRARSHLGRLEDAERDLRRAVELCGDDDERGPALRDLGVLLRQRGELDASAEALAAARGIAHARGDRHGEALALAHEGILAKERGDLEQAQTAYEDAIRELDAVGDPRAAARVRCDLAALYQERGRFDEATRCLDRAHQALGGSGDRLEALVYSDLGSLALETGHADDAERHLALAVSHFVRVGDRRYAALFQATRAAALAALGREEEAAALFAQAERALAADPLFLGAARLHRGHLALARARREHAAGGDPRAAREEAERALASADEPGPGGVPLAALSDDVRFAARALRRALAWESAPTLLVDADMRWVLTPDGQRVELGRKPLLGRLLRALITAHAEARTLSPAELIEAGWPGEHVREESAANRLAVALARLRDLGLRDVLSHGDDGYAIQEGVRVVQVTKS